MDIFSFKRPQLAIAYCDGLQGKGIANLTSGLFLAGPRRVGKSTFLKEDVIPEAQSRGWFPVYVDLWANKEEDPAHLISEAIQAALAKHENVATKLIKKSKLSGVNILGTLTFDFSKPRLPENVTLTSAVQLLGELTQQPVLLIIDEAQHALTTSAGINAMFAIKSARDQLNSLTQSPSLMLIFTGSNRDKLAHVLLKKDQPFFGSFIHPFPLLGRDYTDAFTNWSNKSLAATNQFSKDSIWQAFELLGNRPEMLRRLAGEIALSGEAKNFSKLLEAEASVWHNRIWEEFKSDFNALSPLQKAILQLLVVKGHTWSPFSEESLQAYARISDQKEVAVPAAQTAIQFLRERGFIWQAARGSYALEDESFARWFRHTHSINEC